VASTNPWDATTLEWAATSTPPRAHGNFDAPVRVFRSAYEYSVPGDPAGYLPQNAPDSANA